MRGIIALHALGEKLARDAVKQGLPAERASAWLIVWQNAIQQLHTDRPLGAVTAGNNLADMCADLAALVAGEL